MNSLFVWRWQPLHGGHIELIETALKKNEPVVIAIRDTKKDKNNPYSVRQRRKMIKRAFGDKVKIIKIPDIKKIYIGRDVGYEVVKLSYDIEKISGTRVREMKETSFTVWFTGLSKSGKTTLALALRKKLKKRGIKTRLFDGDFIRGTLWDDLQFTREDRNENVKRVIELCKTKSKLNNIVALISPYRELRNKARKELSGFVEVFVKCPLEICIGRDKNGLYESAKRGDIKNFTGISDPYEEPLNPDVICETNKESIKECVEKIMKKLFKEALNVKS